MQPRLNSFLFCSRRYVKFIFLGKLWLRPNTLKKSVSVRLKTFRKNVLSAMLWASFVILRLQIQHLMLGHYFYATCPHRFNHFGRLYINKYINQENWKKQYNHSRVSYWEYNFVWTEPVSFVCVLKGMEDSKSAQGHIALINLTSSNISTTTINHCSP